MSTNVYLGKMEQDFLFARELEGILRYLSQLAKINYSQTSKSVSGYVCELETAAQKCQIQVSGDLVSSLHSLSTRGC